MSYTLFYIHIHYDKRSDKNTNYIAAKAKKFGKLSDFRRITVVKTRKLID